LRSFEEVPPYHCLWPATFLVRALLRSFHDGEATRSKNARGEKLNRAVHYESVANADDADATCDKMIVISPELYYCCHGLLLLLELHRWGAPLVAIVSFLFAEASRVDTSAADDEAAETEVIADRLMR